METKKGYKNTEVGVIPEDWEEVSLGETATLKARIGWQGLTTAEYLNSGDFYLVTGTDFKSGFIDWDNCVFVEKNRYDQDRNIQVKKGDVLVTKDGTIGKVAYVDRVSKPTTLNSGVFVIRPINEVFNSKYFYYVLMSDHFLDFLKRLTAGSTISHLYQKDFIHFKFLLPSLTEQKAIAQVLSDTDALIQALEKKIAKKKLIKKGAMQKLLSPKEGWEVKKLGEVGESIIGLTYSPNDVKKNGTLVLRSSNIQNGQLAFDDNVYVKMNLHQRVIVKEGDVLICVRNGSKKLIGKCALINKKVEGSAFGAFMTVYRSEYSKYIFHAFQSHFIQKQINEVMGATINQITNKDLNSFILPFPPKEEQEYIAQILSDMDAEIEQLEQKLFKYKQTKQGMMQNLLTGKIRLV